MAPIPMTLSDLHQEASGFRDDWAPHDASRRALYKSTATFLFFTSFV